MKNIRMDCDGCCYNFPIEKITRLSWRYSDKVRRYKTSGVKVVHTGYFHLCPKCLSDKTI